jgi:uncharacterized membrane protein
MNDAHLHLIVNHFPIIGSIFGLGILISGIFLKNNSLKNTAYVIFIVAAIFGLFSMNTGEGAEEIVEDFPNIGKNIIHEHEELAEKFVVFLYATGLLSILGLIANIKKHSKAAIVAYAVTGAALISVFFAQQVGTSGGEIRHTEIRPNATAIGGAESNATSDEQGEIEGK